MRINSSSVEKTGHLMLLILVFFEIFLVIIYLAGIVLVGKAFTNFIDLNAQASFPSLLQAWQLFLIGFISISCFTVGRNSSQPPSQIFLLTVALIFFSACADEVFKIHHLLPTETNHDWKPIYLGIAITTPLVFYRDFIALWHCHRRAVFFIVLGLGVFVFGGLGLELFPTEPLQTLLAKTFPQEDFIPFFVEKLRVALEEFSEMLGESVILYGICLLVAKRLEIQQSSSTYKARTL
ncbi:hypothetical protein [Lyngbya aestuarii]|uniref:hypothetical protein n=1 Tax=Lyngbya aestuarii TaxID=118322 RepID=UPI00403E3560